MVRVVIKMDPSNVGNISEKTAEIQTRGLQFTGQTMLRNLGLNSPVDQGLLRQWYFHNTSTNMIEIRTPAPYAPYVNDGTGIYGPYKTPIYNKKVGHPMAFEVGGRMVFTHMIRGQKPQKFVEKSIQQTTEKLDMIFVKAVRDVFN